MVIQCNARNKRIDVILVTSGIFLRFFEVLLEFGEPEAWSSRMMFSNFLVLSLPQQRLLLSDLLQCNAVALNDGNCHAPA